MKKVLVLMTGLFVAAAINVWAAISIDNITVTGTNSASGAVTVSATISGASDLGASATYQVTSANGLTRRYFPATQASGTSWSSSEWVPYFTGTFAIDITAFDNNHQSYPVMASTTVTVTRAISGTVNAIKYSTAPYNATGAWNDVDTSAVKLHDIGLNLDVGGVGSIGCNLLNATNIMEEMSEEDRDIAYTDTARYKPAGTPYRFDVSLHARPRGFMGMGEIKRWIWAPTDTNVPDGPGQLTVDLTSCSPWRSSYSNALQSHVGFAPLFAPSATGVRADASDMPTGMIMCTSAHYMDVGPTNTGTDADARIGLRVNGHTGTNSYLKMFLSDTFLQQQIGLTNVYDATNLLAGFVQHFDTNGVPIDSVTEVTVSFTRIEGGTNNILYDYNFDGIGDSGYEARFDFEFHSAVAAQMGVGTTPSVILADPVMVDSAGNWYVWFSGLGYQMGGPWSLGVSGTPVAGDFDGDHYADPAVVDQDTGAWSVWFSSLGYQMGGPWSLGVSGTPVAADFDGDEYADPAMVDITDAWYIWFTSLGYQRHGPHYFLGGSGTPVGADFDGDEYADPAMADSSTGAWYVWFSSLAYRVGGPYSLGVSGTPVAGDFDGDGYADPAMVDSTGVWRVWFTSLGYQMGGPWSLGVSGTPLAADFDGQ